MDRDKLLSLLADDEFDLLKVKPKATAAGTANDRLVASFAEICEFVRTRQRPPAANKSDVREYRLFSRLEALKHDPEKAQILLQYDEFSLLSSAKEIASIDDIYEDDDLGILSGGDAGIFELKNVPKETTMPEYVAQRRPCQNFDEFASLFASCQADLAAGRRHLWRFSKEQQIEKGLFFVLKGVLLYVAEVGVREMVNGKNNARLRCIFENGTESDMLLRSLSAELYKDGRRVSLRDDELLDGLDTVSEGDTESGYVYVLKSLSTREDITALKHLHKVGFSRFRPEDRVRGAEADPTFLMAPVAIVSAFKLYNLNPNHLENLLHRFFGAACVEIEVIDKDGAIKRPREWFLAPVNVIEQAIHLLQTGDVVHFRYDAQIQEIVAR